MKKTTLLACLLGLGMVACNQKNADNGIQFSAHLDIPKENNEVTVFSFNSDGTPDTVASLHADEHGGIDASIDIENPDIFGINVYGEKSALIILDDGEATLDYDSNQGRFVVGGNQDNEKLEEYYSLNEQQQEKFKKLYEEFQVAEDDAARMAIQQRAEQMQGETMATFKNFIRETGPTLASLFVLEQLDVKEEAVFIDSMVTLLAQEYPNNEMIKAKKEALEVEKRTAVGEVAPEIKLPTPTGEEVALSSLRGKYVMIDFWASWCGPCRAENPNVVKMYNKYHDKGFEIFGVSLDRDRAAWEKAIAKDELTWVQVSDLKFWQSEAAKTYNIQAIPATLLLDKEGRIIAKNLRGEALEAKLEEIFN